MVRLSPVSMRGQVIEAAADAGAEVALPGGKQAATHDMATGLPNAMFFESFLGYALARRLVLPLLLAHCARQQPLLLVIDDAQWLDAESAELIGFAMRRRPGATSTAG